jgi:hypothetical protein
LTLRHQSRTNRAIKMTWTACVLAGSYNLTRRQDRGHGSRDTKVTTDIGRTEKCSRKRIINNLYSEHFQYETCSKVYSHRKVFWLTDRRPIILLPRALLIPARVGGYYGLPVATSAVDCSLRIQVFCPPSALPLLIPVIDHGWGFFPSSVRIPNSTFVKIYSTI